MPCLERSLQARPRPGMRVGAATVARLQPFPQHRSGLTFFWQGMK